MTGESKITMTRVIVGVASVGATLALVYLYNKYQERQSKRGVGGGSSRVRRQSSKSGDVKKVTFKETDDEERESLRVHEPSVTTETSKLLANKGEEDLPGVDLHEDSTKDVSSSTVNGTRVDDDDADESSRSSGNTTNHYENNSTLKLEDSRGKKSSGSTSTPVLDEKRPVEDVISRSKGPLMTSTPLPGKDLGGHVGLRQAALFDAHRSDMKSSAQGTSASATTAVGSEADDTFTFRKEMRIPRETVPALIGKKGCNIKGIQAQSGTTINFHDQTLENGDRTCVIRGAPANVTIAESLIEKFIIEQPTVYTEVLAVPLSSVGRIIGRGGENIRSIQELSKARVNVESHNHYGNDSGPTRSITIKGSEDQILVAKQLIMEKVDEERNLKKSIEVATANRTHRRGGGTSPSFPNPPAPISSTASTGSNEPVLPLKQDGILEVFVSCVYHPNDFWIQVVGRDSIELDKLCESMTDFYNGGRHNEQTDKYNVGDIVAAPFEVDGKIYRAKIMRIDDKEAEVSYLDYGDRRVLPLSEIYDLHPNFLQLRYQAIQATLNLGCIGEKWNDEVINEFCDRTFCAQWQSLTARVKDYLKDLEDGHDVIWIELLDKETNIGDELVRKGLATPKGPSGCNGAQGSQRKSYAAVALGGTSNGGHSSEPFISSTDPTIQESVESERNGN